MHQKTFFTQALRYQKAISENAFSLFSVVQHSGVEMLKQSLDHHSWLPVSDKKSCLYWSERCVQATEQLRSIMEKGFEEAEKQLSTVSPGEAKPKAPSKPLSSSQQTVKASVQKSTPPKSPVSTSAKAEVIDIPKDSASSSLKRSTAAQKKAKSAAPKAAKAAPKSKSAATKAESITTEAKSTTTEAKSTTTRKTRSAKTTGKTSTAKPKPSVAARSTAAKKTATKKTAKPASKQSN